MFGTGKSRIGLIGTVMLGSMMGSNCQDEAYVKAHKKLLADLRNTSITVYPTVVRTTGIAYDADSASKLALFFATSELATVTISQDHVSLPGQWGTNQSKMYRESAEALGEHIKTHPIKTDYALLAEYLIGSKGIVVGIHCYISDNHGQLANAEGLNSHHTSFSNASPKTVEDCDRLLIECLRESLIKPKGSSETPSGGNR